MFREGYGINKAYIVVGYTDLRLGIDSLATIVKEKYKLNPFERGILFLFCGRKTDRIKALLWEGDGFLLLYKRFERGHMQWPRSTNEAAAITMEQYKLLMRGFNPIETRIYDVSPSKII